MDNNEMYDAAYELLQLNNEYEQTQDKIRELQEECIRINAAADAQRDALLDTVGANIQERIIPVGESAIIIQYHENGNKLRISDRVVTCDVH